ncbi:MAG: 16S rRNA (cytosine(967)-C(5))-methyltransferase RsmB [Proteocatella sp.]
MKKPRELAYEIINNVINEGGYSNISINKVLRKHNLENKDRGFLTELVYGTIENKLYLDYVIQKYSKQKLKDVSKEVLIILEMGLYQIRDMDSVTDFAAVDESVKLCKKIYPKGSGFVNAILRNILRDKTAFDIDIKDPVKKVSVEYSISRDIAELVISQYGLEEAEDIFYGFSQKPQLYIRVNRLKTEPNELKNLLEKEGIEVEFVSENPDALRVKNMKNIENNPQYKSGLFTIQDISSMRCVKEVDPKKEERILDLCACPGGKTTYMAELMENSGEIDARDISQNKLELVQMTCKRLGISIVNIAASDASIYNSEFEGIYDRVLADVPCSGLGIIKRKPEIRYKKLKDIESLYEIQKKIIENASKYVKNDGILIYSTCTINKSENEDITNWFLENNPNYKRLQDDILMLPSESENDGFYICKLQRIS